MAYVPVIAEAGSLAALSVICLFELKFWGKTQNGGKNPHTIQHHTDIIWYYTTKTFKNADR
jgi:hypothetical protein